ncbi:MAG: ParB/RepB/Spo0J family partition protein [Oscillospiraceae bacterium]|nr:ParB/RepB/Spo0J family partition protein [Oscillospiraceae bacterium]
MLTKKNGLMETRKIHMIKTDNIRPNPYQPRSVFEREGLQDLSESIRQFGVIQPLTVRRNGEGGYELVAGERRLRAARMAGLCEVPCILMGIDDKQSGILALIENIQRCDLDFFEEAGGIQRLVRQFGLSQEETAKRLGKSQSAIANKLRILRHPAHIIEMIRRYGLTERHARTLLRIEDTGDKAAAIAYINEHRLNVAQTEEYIDNLVSSGEAPPKEQRNIKTLYVFRDVRLFLNTVNKAVEAIRRSGLDADVQKEESQEEIALTIRIPKKA